MEHAPHCSGGVKSAMGSDSPMPSRGEREGDRPRVLVFPARRQSLLSRVPRALSHEWKSGPQQKNNRRARLGWDEVAVVVTARTSQGERYRRRAIRNNSEVATEASYRGFCCNWRLPFDSLPVGIDFSAWITEFPKIVSIQSREQPSVKTGRTSSPQFGCWIPSQWRNDEVIGEMEKEKCETFSRWADLNGKETA